MSVTEGADSHVRAVIAARTGTRARQNRSSIAATIRWLQALRRDQNSAPARRSTGRR
jgi:hypothetical protein